MTATKSPSERPSASDVVVRFPDGRTYCGPIVDLREIEAGSPGSLSRAALRRAVVAGCPAPADAPAVEAPPPGPVHECAASLAPETRLDRRRALSAVAAARGIETPHDGELAAARRALRRSTAGAVDAEALRAARRRAAEAGAETERLRERVATIRGRVNALREITAEPEDAVDNTDVTDATDSGARGSNPGDDDTGVSGAAAEASLSEATRRLSEATRRLSEVATDRVAAAQRLDLLERRARAGRDDRSARLRLEDRVGNLERAVRDARVAAVEAEFRDARSRFASRIDRFEDSGAASPDLRDALAVVSIAPVRAPVVVAAAVAEGLGGPASAFELLDAPLVIR
ncbi:DUF7856 family protein [Halobellus sp. GM3]|uniref:DUF7856 family protein n=1 Tax=Halobellus sp. GM3 TaxID=3458410 RepID=UPI00403D9ACC